MSKFTIIRHELCIAIALFMVTVNSSAAPQRQSKTTSRSTSKTTSVRKTAPKPVGNAGSVTKVDTITMAQAAAVSTPAAAEVKVADDANPTSTTDAKTETATAAKTAVTTDVNATTASDAKEELLASNAPETAEASQAETAEETGKGGLIFLIVLTVILGIALTCSLIFNWLLSKKVKSAKQKEIYYKSRVYTPSMYKDNEAEATSTSSETPVQTATAPAATISTTAANAAPNSATNAELAEKIRIAEQHKEHIRKLMMENAQKEKEEEQIEAQMKEGAPNKQETKSANSEIKPIKQEIKPKPITIVDEKPQPTEESAPVETTKTEPINKKKENVTQNDTALLATKKLNETELKEKQRLLYEIMHARAEMEQPLKLPSHIKSFMREFNTAYPGSLDSLAKEHPEITGSDKLVLALMVNDLSINEICTLLEAKPRTIWSRRLRIKTHLNLDKDGNLDSWVKDHFGVQ